MASSDTHSPASDEPAAWAVGDWPIGGPQDIFLPRAGATIPLPTIVRGSGIYVYDDAGNRYIDASSGPVVNNLGHGNERVIAAMADQASRLCFSSPRQTRTRENIELAEKLARLAGPGFERAFFTTGGSEAVDMALKFVRQSALARGQAERTKIVSCMPSYHGGTMAAAAISGDWTLDEFLTGMAVPSAKVPAPLTYRLPDGHDAESYAAECAAALEGTILSLGPETVLAFVLEPVGGLASGASVPPDSYIREVRRICTAYGVFLIHDEVLCGAGRTGHFLASHHWPDALPDVVVLAKGASAGYTPMSVVLTSAALVDELAELTGFSFGHTYVANPLSCAIVSAVVDEIDRLDLIRAASERGARLRRRLEEVKERSPVVGDVRGRGLLLSVEIVADKATKTSFDDVVAPDALRVIGLRHGLLLYARRTNAGRFGDWVMLTPPLIITDDEIDDLVARFEQTLDDFAKQVGSRG
jgi:adenosylmethionine-8-amino-7-oxononanoate aminotransferase